MGSVELGILPLVHYNSWWYAELGFHQFDQVVQESMGPFLDLALRPENTSARFLFEVNGMTLEALAGRYPAYIDLMRQGVQREVLEPMASTRANPLVPTVPTWIVENNIHRWGGVWNELFGDLSQRPEMWFPPEYYTDARMPGVLNRFGYRGQLVWADHIARDLGRRGKNYLSSRKYLEPFWIQGAEAVRSQGVAIHGEEIHRTRVAAANGAEGLDDYIDYLEQVAKERVRGPGILLTGPADGEFFEYLQLGDMSPIRMDWMQQFVRKVQDSDVLTFRSVRDTLRLGVPQWQMRLGAGGSRDDTNPWMRDPNGHNLRLHTSCSEMAREIEAVRPVVGILGGGVERQQLDRAEEHLEQAWATDCRGYHPVFSKRQYGFSCLRDAQELVADLRTHMGIHTTPQPVVEEVVLDTVMPGAFIEEKSPYG